MVVTCYAGDIISIEYDRRTPELSNAPLNITQDTNSIENFNVRLTCSYEKFWVRHDANIGAVVGKIEVPGVQTLLLCRFRLSYITLAF